MTRGHLPGSAAIKNERTQNSSTLLEVRATVEGRDGMGTRGRILGARYRNMFNLLKLIKLNGLHMCTFLYVNSTSIKSFYFKGTVSKNGKCFFLFVFKGEELRTETRCLNSQKAYKQG